ncbi:MAG TPA: OmpA family protein [Chryseosolibacter sp.]
MKRTVGIGVFLLLSALVCNAQTDELLAYGKVTDARTNKGIKASIHYSSIPTGSIHGDFNDSTFSFQIFGTARYKITAEAQGYTTKTIIVDPKDIDVDKKAVVKDIKLSRSGDAIRLNHLIFAQGQSTIEPQSFPELDEIALMMSENPKVEIQLEGHTDNVGSSDANLKLSQQRVDAVKAYLVKKGIKKSRIKTKAFGGSKPLQNEMTPEARILNRRVEMRILKD